VGRSKEGAEGKTKRGTGEPKNKPWKKSGLIDKGKDSQKFETRAKKKQRLSRYVGDKKEPINKKNGEGDAKRKGEEKQKTR